MRRTVIALLALVFILPLTVQAREWNAEQHEVWAALEACSNAGEIEELRTCFHDDFVGWGADNGIPQKKADRMAGSAWFYETAETVWLHLKPLSIDVRGDMAIVLYVYSFVDRNKLKGEETSGTTNWTDIMVREGNKWVWLADHGTDVGGN